MKRLLAVALAASCLAPCAASAAEARWYAQVDNDAAFDTDRWYTSGVRVARVADQGSHELEVGLVQEIYTPWAKRFVPGDRERAPAARLLLTLARHDPGPQCLRTLEVAVGVAGPSAGGERTTDAAHRIVPSPEVDWSREEGDRLDAHLAAARSDRHGDVTLHFGAVAGTSRVFAHAGAQWNVGAGVDSQLLRFAPTPPPSGAPRWGGFVGVSVRAVARDELLTRNYDATLPGLRREAVVGRLAAGIAAVRPWGAVTFALAMDSREFEGQRAAHRFGSLAVHLAF